MTQNRFTAPWAQVDLDEMRRLFDEGWSMGRIALALGRSRSSIAGKLRRLGIKRGDTPTQGLARRHRPPNPRRRKGGTLKRSTPPPRPVGAPKFNVVPFKPREPEKPLPPLNVGIYDLTPAHCRWPVSGEREHTLFCGHQRVTGSSYCGQHKALSVSLGTVSERQAHHAPKVA